MVFNFNKIKANKAVVKCIIYNFKFTLVFLFVLNMLIVCVLVC